MNKTTFKTQTEFQTWAFNQGWILISYNVWSDAPLAEKVTHRVEVWMAPSGRQSNVHYDDQDNVTHITPA